VSRIWRALKEAEREKSRRTLGDHKDDRPQSQVVVAPDRRASNRREQSFLVLVYGSDAEKQPFHEESETLDVNENGCSLLLETAVVRGQRLFLANTLNQAEQKARVMHVGRRIRGKSRVGIEFIRASPEFWSAD
jgi:hypothetical protein